jgi:hypothetical protein
MADGQKWGWGGGGGGGKKFKKSQGKEESRQGAAEKWKAKRPSYHLWTILHLLNTQYLVLFRGTSYKI